MIAWPAMTAAPTMQREAVRRAVVAVLAILTVRPVGVLALLRRLLLRRLAAAGDERRQPLNVLIVGLLEVLRTRLVILRLRMRLLM
jgi:hypothetical protein